MMYSGVVCDVIRFWHVLVLGGGDGGRHSRGVGRAGSFGQPGSGGGGGRVGQGWQEARSGSQQGVFVFPTSLVVVVIVVVLVTPPWVFVAGFVAGFVVILVAAIHALINLWKFPLVKGGPCAEGGGGEVAQAPQALLPRDCFQGLHTREHLLHQADEGTAVCLGFPRLVVVVGICGGTVSLMWAFVCLVIQTRHVEGRGRVLRVGLRWGCVVLAYRFEVHETSVFP